MQIKRIGFLLMLVPMLFGNVALADVSDWFVGNCKQVTDKNGQSVRRKDIGNKSEFKNAKFYRGLCSGQKAQTGKSYCVDIFKDAQVHDMIQAIQIAKDYASETNNDVVTCHPDYWSCKDNDDHILCSTSDNGAHYEFIFDDITEKSDEKYKKGIATSYCKIFFQDGIKLDDAYKYNYKSAQSEKMSANDMINCWPDNTHREKGDNWVYDQCVKMDSLLKKSFTSYSVEPDRYKCLIDFGSASARLSGVSNLSCSEIQNELPAINNIRFKSQQINLNQNVTAWLAGYVQRQINEEVKDFKCDLAPHTCKTGETFNPNDDVLTCYVNGKRIDFLFDDLSESGNKMNQGAQSAMQCMSETDGSFDGRRCRGLDKKQCSELDGKITGGTKWDDKLDACVFKAANAASNLNRVKEVSITVGTSTVILAGVVAMEVVSGGTATSVVVAALPAVVGVMASGASETIITYQRNTTQEYMTQLEKCSNAQCARELLNTYFDKISYYDNNLPDDVIMSLDDHLAAKVELLAGADKARFFNAIAESSNRGIIERYFDGNAPADVYAKLALDVIAVVADFIPTAKSAAKVLSKFNKLPKTAAKVVQTSSKFAKAAKTSRRTLDNLDKLDTAKDLAEFYMSYAGAPL